MHNGNCEECTPGEAAGLTTVADKTAGPASEACTGQATEPSAFEK